MSRAFNLTAEINLRGPSNIRTVVADIRRQIGTINVNINPQISPAASRNIGRLNTDLQRLNRAFSATRIAANDASAAIRNFGQALNGVASNNIQQNFNNAVNACQNLGRAAGGAGGDIGGAATQMEEFGRQSALAIRRFAAFSVVTTGIYAFTNAISKGVSAFIDFDKEFVRLQQVTGESAKGLQSLSSEITRLSTGLGIASKDLTTVAVTLAQAGLSATDTKKALEALALSALAPSFDDMNETVEGSIALMRQFGIGAGDLEGALGSINSVAAKFAVEASDIITAIQRTGGVFATASKGVSEGTDALNEFVAIFTSVRQTTRESAETIATGLRTIFTRIQRGGTIQALKEYGVELTDLEGKFVGPFEAVKRLSEGLNQLDPRDIRFSRIVEELGGFRQIGKVIPLIQQFAVAQQALKVAQTGQASLAEDAATAQLSVANQIAKVREEFTALIRSIGESDSFRSFVTLSLQLTSALIKLADAAKIVLPALTAIAAVRGASAAYQFGAGFSGALGGGRGGRGGRRFASGGLVPGSGSGDTVPAMLTPGEFVIRKKAVEKLGAGNLHNINRYASGGIVEQGAVGAAILKGKTKKTTAIPKSMIMASKKNKQAQAEIDQALTNKNSFTYVKEPLSKNTYKDFSTSINKGIITGLNKAASDLSAKIPGIPNKAVAPPKKNINNFLSSINEGVRGSFFESILDSMMNQGKWSENTEGTTAPFDFPNGLTGDSSMLFPSLASIKFIDAKASFSAAKDQKIAKKIGNQILLEKGLSSLIGTKKSKTQKISDIKQQILSRMQSGKTYSPDIIKGSLKQGGLGISTVRSADLSALSQGPDSILVQIGKRYALRGGMPQKASGGNVDTVPALLTPGEFVINKKAASRLGEATLHNLNRADKIQGFNRGGSVGNIQKFFFGGRSRNVPSGGGWTGNNTTPLSNFGNFRGGGGMPGMGAFIALTAGGAAVDSIGGAIGEEIGGQIGKAAVQSFGGDILNLGAIGAQIGSFFGPQGAIIGGIVGGTAGFVKALFSLESTINEVNKEIKSKELESQSEKTQISIGNFEKSASMENRIKAIQSYRDLADVEAQSFNLQKFTSSSKTSELVKAQESGSIAAIKIIEAEIKRTGVSTFEEFKNIFKLDPELFADLSQDIAEADNAYATAQIKRAKEIEDANGDPKAIAIAQSKYKKIIDDITKNSIRLVVESRLAPLRQQQVNQQIENTIDIYSRINAALLRFNSDIDTMRDSALQTVRDLDGSSTIEKSQRVGENVLGNMSAYSSAEVSNAADLVSKAVGGEVGKNLSENIKASKFVSDKLPGILTATAQGENADIVGAITKQAETEKVKLPKFLLEDISKTIKSFSSGIGEGQGKSVRELAQDPELLSKLSKVLEASSETAAKALKTYYDSLDKVTELQNEYIKTIGVANEYQRKASEIQLNSALDLKKVRGQEISLAEMNQPFETNIRALTGGVTDPTQIANIIKSSQEEATRLETQRNEAINKGDTEAIKKNDQALINNRLRLNNATNALKQLADNSSRASNALSKIQEKAARNEATVGTIENILTAGPEELLKMTDQFKAVASGAQAGPEFFAGPQGFRNREMAFGGLNLIKDLIPNEQYRALRGQFIEQSLKGLGLDNNPFFKKIMEDFKAGGVSEEDPTVKEYKRLVSEQQQSNTALQKIYEGAANKLLTTSETIFAKLNADLPTIIKNAYELARKEIKASLEAANPIVPPKEVEQAPPVPRRNRRPVARQTGGIIYASNGQMIDFQPKGTDTVPAMLTPGEFVVNARATKQNLGLLRSINNGGKGYSRGGVVYLADGGAIPKDYKPWDIDINNKQEGFNDIFYLYKDKIKRFIDYIDENNSPWFATKHQFYDLTTGKLWHFLDNLRNKILYTKYGSNSNLDDTIFNKIWGGINFETQHPYSLLNAFTTEGIPGTNTYKVNSRTEEREMKPGEYNSSAGMWRIIRNGREYANIDLGREDFVNRDTSTPEGTKKLKYIMLEFYSRINSMMNEPYLWKDSTLLDIPGLTPNTPSNGNQDTSTNTGLWDNNSPENLSRLNNMLNDAISARTNGFPKRAAEKLKLAVGSVVKIKEGDKISTGLRNFSRQSQSLLDDLELDGVPWQDIQDISALMINRGIMQAGTVYKRSYESEEDALAAVNRRLNASGIDPNKPLNFIPTDYYDELTYKEFIKKRLQDKLEPIAPDKNKFITDAIYASRYVQPTLDNTINNKLREIDTKGNNQKVRITAYDVRDTRQQNEYGFAKVIDKGMGLNFNTELPEEIKKSINGRNGKLTQYDSAYSFYRDKLGAYNYKNKNQPSYMNNGGVVYASNGMLTQFKPKAQDTIPAMLSKGEFVVNRNATANNLPLLQSLNKGGMVKYYQNGGRVGGADNAQASNTSLSTINLSDNAQSALSTFTSNFGSYVDSLVNFSFPTIPDKIEMVGSHTVDVRVTGAAAFESLQEGIKKLIDNSINQKMGEMWNQTGGQIGKAPSLPSKK